VEEMKNLDQVQQLIEVLWFTHVTRLWTHIVNNEKQTLKGLKKIDDDVQW
jgi:hypothetical protein